jgi:hypothetical protein
MGFGPLLSQLVILGWDRDGRATFRLAGGMVTELHGRDLRDAELYPLWQREQRQRLQTHLADARRSAQPVVLRATGTGIHGTRVDLEITLAPLAGPNGEADRFIGLYQLLTPVPFLAGRPVSQLSLTGAERISLPNAEPRTAAGAQTHLRLVVDNGRRVA